MRSPTSCARCEFVRRDAFFPPPVLAGIRAAFGVLQQERARAVASGVNSPDDDWRDVEEWIVYIFKMATMEAHILSHRQSAARAGARRDRDEGDADDDDDDESGNDATTNVLRFHHLLYDPVVTATEREIKAAAARVSRSH